MLEAVELMRSTPDRTVLLDGVSLKIATGGRYAIFGPTGSGKTLFLRALALLDATDSGEVLWEGEPVPDDRVPAFRRNVIYLHQRPALIEGNVQDNLQLPWSFDSARKGVFDVERAEGYLKCVGRTENFLRRKTPKLSGGERQIVALVRAMLLKPRVLLLDEPTAALDSVSRNNVESLIASYIEEGSGDRASVWVTHDADQVRRVADWKVPIEAGRLGEIERVG